MGVECSSCTTSGAERRRYRNTAKGNDTEAIIKNHIESIAISASSAKYLSSINDDDDDQERDQEIEGSTPEDHQDPPGPVLDHEIANQSYVITCDEYTSPTTPMMAMKTTNTSNTQKCVAQTLSATKMAYGVHCDDDGDDEKHHELNPDPDPELDEGAGIRNEHTPSDTKLNREMHGMKKQKKKIIKEMLDDDIDVSSSCHSALGLEDAAMAVDSERDEELDVFEEVYDDYDPGAVKKVSTSNLIKLESVDGWPTQRVQETMNEMEQALAAQTAFHSNTASRPQ